MALTDITMTPATLSMNWRKAFSVTILLVPWIWQGATICCAFPRDCGCQRCQPRPMTTAAHWFQTPSATRLLSTTAGEDLKASSFLSHVMLKVPSVDDSVEYWTEDVGGKIRISRPLENDDGDSTSRQSLMSAFVELGCSKRNDKDADVTSPVCFALELVRAKKENYLPGNVISYIGVSMLLQFENNLLGVITGDEAPKEQAEEPNGIAVKSSASAPGDYFARFALKTNNLEATHAFYTGVLGMECKAEDATMVCLRYENETFQAGVSTTLVFDATDEELVKGDCFDHIAITTDASIAVIFDKLEGEKVFMKPTEMFGKQVLGLLDPNGYKVVVAGI